MKNKILTKDEILSKLDKNKDKIKSFGVKKLWLFGSYARGEQDENSDIDFLVEFETGKNDYKNELELGIFLEEVFEKNVDLGERRLLKKGCKDYIFNDGVLEVKV